MYFFYAPPQEVREAMLVDDAAKILRRPDFHWGVHADALHVLLTPPGKPEDPFNRTDVMLNKQARLWLLGKNETWVPREAEKIEFEPSGASTGKADGVDASLASAKSTMNQADILSPQRLEKHTIGGRSTKTGSKASTFTAILEKTPELFWTDPTLNSLRRAHEVYYLLMPFLCRYLAVKAGREVTESFNPKAQLEGWIQHQDVYFPRLRMIHRVAPHDLYDGMGIPQSNTRADRLFAKVAGHSFPATALVELSALICRFGDGFKTRESDCLKARTTFFVSVMDILNRWALGQPVSVELNVLQKNMLPPSDKGRRGGRGRVSALTTKTWQSIFEDISNDSRRYIEFMRSASNPLGSRLFENGKEQLHPAGLRSISKLVTDGILSGQFLDMKFPPARILSRFRFHGVFKQDLNADGDDDSEVFKRMVLAVRDPSILYSETEFLQEMLFVSDLDGIQESLAAPMVAPTVTCTKDQHLYVVSGIDKPKRAFITWVLLVKKEEGLDDILFETLQRAIAFEVAHRYVLIEMGVGVQGEVLDRRLAFLLKRLEQWRQGSSSFVTVKRIVAPKIGNPLSQSVHELRVAHILTHPRGVRAVLEYGLFGG